MLDELNALIEQREATQLRDSLRSYLGRARMVSTARRLYRLARERELPDAEREPGYQERDLSRIRDRLERLDRRYDARVEKAVWSQLIERYRELPAEMRMADFDRFLGLDQEGNDLDRLLQGMYDGTELDEIDKRHAGDLLDAVAKDLVALPLLAPFGPNRLRHLAATKAAAIVGDDGVQLQ